MTCHSWEIMQMNGNWSFLTDKRLLMVGSGKE